MTWQSWVAAVFGAVIVFLAVVCFVPTFTRDPAPQADQTGPDRTRTTDALDTRRPGDEPDVSYFRGFEDTNPHIRLLAIAEHAAEANAILGDPTGLPSRPARPTTREDQ
jgi:hypothetical protein